MKKERKEGKKERKGEEKENEDRHHENEEKCKRIQKAKSVIYDTELLFSDAIKRFWRADPFFFILSFLSYLNLSFFFLFPFLFLFPLFCLSFLNLSFFIFFFLFRLPRASLLRKLLRCHIYISFSPFVPDLISFLACIGPFS